MLVVVLTGLPAMAAEKPNILELWGDNIDITDISAYRDGLVESLLA